MLELQRTLSGPGPGFRLGELAAEYIAGARLTDNVRYVRFP